MTSEEYQSALDLLLLAAIDNEKTTSVDRIKNQHISLYQEKADIIRKAFNNIGQLQQENERLNKSNDGRLRDIKELRKEIRDLCSRISDLCSQIDKYQENEEQRIKWEYEDMLE